MKDQSEMIYHLSVELTRAQMIYKSIINVLERKNILTEKEVLDELEIIVSSTLKEYSLKIKEEETNNNSFLNFEKIGKA